VLLREDGTFADISVNARATGLSPSELRRIPRRICAVAGVAKAAAVLGARYDWRFGAVAVGVVLVYGTATFSMANWRLEHRRAMNAADSEAAGLSVDALLNYETVKSFGAETRAAEAYDQSLSTYVDAALKANTSLAALNMIQGLIMTSAWGSWPSWPGSRRRRGGWGRAT